MAEYIEREKLLLELEEMKRMFLDIGGMTHQYFATGVALAIEDVKKIPAADVAPVRHGLWIPVEGGQHKCSYCHTVRKADIVRDRYCPNCGAKMDMMSESDTGRGDDGGSGS